MTTYLTALLVWAPFVTLFDGTLVEPIFLFGGAYSQPMWLKSDRLLVAHV